MRGNEFGSLATGVAQGVGLYAGIQNAVSNKKLNDLKLKSLEGQYAESERSKALEADANRLGKIGLDQAKLKYGDDVKKVMDHYYTQTIPQQQQFWLENGQPEKADMLGKVVQTNQGRLLTESSALAIRQASLGDYDNIGPTLENLMNLSGQILGQGGNVKFKSATKLDNGGAKIDFLDDNGKDQSMSFNNSSDLITFIRNNAMPDKIVDYAFDQEKAAQDLKIKTAQAKLNSGLKIQEKVADHKLTIARDNNSSGLRMVENKQKTGLAMEQELNKAQVQQLYGTSGSGGAATGKKVAEAEAAASYLRNNGYTEEQIQESLPALLGIQNNTKAPSVRIEETIKLLANSDTSFARLSDTDKIKRAKEFIKLIDDRGASAMGQPAAVAAAPTQQQATPGKTPVFDTKTGQIVYR